MLWNAKRGWARGVDRMSHVELTESILTRTPTEAAELMRQHVRRGLKSELEALELEENPVR
jgi:DNA-binding GntR family transcriptional regulator